MFNLKDIFIMSTTGCMDTEADSMESIIAGNEAGATGAVLTLDMTADGIAVLCGRGGFSLPDGSTAALHELTFGEMRAVHLKIVSVGQAVELVKSCGGKLCAELKNPALCAQVRLSLSHADYLDDSYFVGMGLAEAARHARQCPNLHFMADVFTPAANESALVHSAQDAGLFGLRVAPAILTRALCDEAHHVGLFVASTECHDEIVLGRLVDMGVNFIETLRPDIVYGMLPQPEDQSQITL